MSKPSLHQQQFEDQDSFDLKCKYFEGFEGVFKLTTLYLFIRTRKIGLKLAVLETFIYFQPEMFLNCFYFHNALEACFCHQLW